MASSEKLPSGEKRIYNGDRVGSTVWSETRNVLGGAKKQPTNPIAALTEWETLKATSRFAGKNERLHAKSGPADQNKMWAGMEQNRKNMAQEIRMNAQGRAYQLAQKMAKKKK